MKAKPFKMITFMSIVPFVLFRGMYMYSTYKTFAIIGMAITMIGILPVMYKRQYILKRSVRKEALHTLGMVIIVIFSY